MYGPILIIDNYDSFTYNLVQYLGELGGDIVVRRNDKISLEEIRAMNPERIVISPGPGTPDDAGISLDVIRVFGPTTPLLGVCLGHQAIGQAYGGTVVNAGQLMHGKVSDVTHRNDGVFANLKSPLQATRYHSLVVRREDLPECLTITAESDDGEIMGLKHKSFPVEGVQFHPESILTTDGMSMIRNFMKQ